MKNYLYLALVILSIVTSSCSDKLSNGKAEKLIKQEISFPKPEDVGIQYGVMAFVIEYQCSGIGDFIFKRQRQAQINKIERYFIFGLRYYERLK